MELIFPKSQLRMILTFIVLAWRIRSLIDLGHGVMDHFQEGEKRIGISGGGRRKQSTLQMQTSGKPSVRKRERCGESRERKPRSLIDILHKSTIVVIFFKALNGEMQLHFSELVSFYTPTRVLPVLYKSLFTYTWDNLRLHNLIS